MKKQYFLLVLIAILLFFPIIPYFCFRQRGVTGFTYLIAIYFVTGFIIGFLRKISFWRKLTIITVPIDASMFFAICIHYYYPSWGFAITNFFEYLVLVPLMCYLGLYAQQEIMKRSYLKVLYSVLFFTSVLVLGIWLLPDYYFYMYHIENTRKQVISNEIRLRTLENGIITNQELKGKILLLDFWSSSCGSCIEQMAELTRIEAKYKSNDKVKILTINAGYPDTFEKFVKSTHTRKYKDKLQMFYDDNKQLSKSLDVNKFPQLYLVDAKGMVRKHIQGYVPDKEANFISNLTTEIDKLLKE